MSFFDGEFDVIVLGAGHAGCEAAFACARRGLNTMMLTMNLDSVGLMPCNPAIGGTSKGHLVRELDALGGEMGLAADDTFIMMRMLNTAKGPAVHSLRAQMDKRRYHERMKRALERQEKLTLKQGEAVRILEENGKVCGLQTRMGAQYACRAVVVATGVYLKSRILIGDVSVESGPSGLFPATALSDSLRELGITLRRFKTGTPARVNKNSLDFSRMEPQYGDVPIVPFSFMSGVIEREQVPCYLTYTNQQTHDIIRANIHRSPMYSGLIKGVGVRYCPSIEDKIMRFADKDRHQIFIEPEGNFTDEMYVQGMSTSLPEDVQKAMLRTLPGLEHCSIMRPGYAIEYDCIDSRQLSLSMAVRGIDGLYMAGQINGSSGYEEAAAQGIMAGINAALYLKGEAPLVLDRSEAYIGVLIDDLVTKGTNEPYRMMTSRAEYRLTLRQDNADLRLTDYGRRVGLVTDARYDQFMRKRDAIDAAMSKLRATAPHTPALSAMLESKGEAPPRSGLTWFDLFKRVPVTYDDLRTVNTQLDALPADVVRQLEITAKYDGYIQKQQRQVEQFKYLENMPLTDDIDYASIATLRIEARQKLAAQRPVNIGQASRISGVSPADIAVLMVFLEKRRREKCDDAC
jgi:tRNA uridine 5-carboxymethylaminomethyl modification enzyme